MSVDKIIARIRKMLAIANDDRAGKAYANTVNLDLRIEKDAEKPQLK